MMEGIMKATGLKIRLMEKGNNYSIKYKSTKGNGSQMKGMEKEFYKHQKEH